MLTVAREAVVEPFGVKYTLLFAVVTVVPAGMGFPFISVNNKSNLFLHVDPIVTVVDDM
jgi:hypothetical protein